jgi:hypothetical protein
MSYVYPTSQSAKIGRTDQGVDYNLKPGEPIRAIGKAKILHIDPNFYQGEPAIYYELLEGKDKGKIIYVAEEIDKLAKVGSTVAAGSPVAYYAPSGTGVEEGFGAANALEPLGHAGYTEGQETAAGKSFKAFRESLGGGGGGIISEAEGTASEIGSGITSGVSALTTIGEWLGDPVRLAKLVGGGIILFIGVKALTKGTPAQAAGEAPGKVAGAAGRGASTATKKGKNAVELKKAKKATKKKAAEKVAKKAAEASVAA